MNWRTKAKLQNFLARLPGPVGFHAYYWLQRHFGALRRPTPIEHFTAALDAQEMMQRFNRSAKGAVFLEIGTGRRVNTPIGFWLLGAARTVTVDLHPYLKSQLVHEDINYVVENRREVEELFGERIIKDRFAALLDLATNQWKLADLLSLCGIEYHAPSDAANLSVEAASIDFHTSYTVLEHIPEPTLVNILREGLRVLKSDGLFVHRIDYSDHFSHSDQGISPVNFLQFSDEAWSRIAGNRFMYMNRLRVDDFLDVYKRADHAVREVESIINAGVQEALQRGDIEVDKRFSTKSPEVLATTGSWIVSSHSP